jgi:hypothetical protein
MFAKIGALGCLALLTAACADERTSGQNNGAGGLAENHLPDASPSGSGGGGGPAVSRLDGSVDSAIADASLVATDAMEVVDGSSPPDLTSGGSSDGGVSDTMLDAGSPAAKWTILIYGHGDNTLSNSLFQDMAEMASAHLNDKVNVVLLADWDASQHIPGETENFPTGSQWFRFAGGGAAPELIASSPELDLDDPAVLSAAITYAYTKFPAQRYGLVLWDHGGSWNAGFGGDTQDGTRAGVGLSAEAVATAVRMGLSRAGLTGDRPLEFFSYDTCLMAGAEVTATVKALAKTYLANAEIDYGAGWDYETTLTWIAQHPDASAREVAAAEVVAWNAHHATSTTSDILLRSHVAIDLTKFDAFQSATRSFVATLQSNPTSAADVSRAFSVSLPGYWTEFTSPQPAQLRDVGQLLRDLKAHAGGAIATASSQVLDALAGMRIGGSAGAYRAEQDGFHIFAAPISTIEPASFTSYGQLASTWNGITSWSAGLQAVLAAADAAGPVIQGTGTVPENPGPGNLPTVHFSIADADLLYAEAELVQQHPTIPDTFVVYGFLAASLLSPGDSTLTWSGSLLTIPTSTTDLIVTARPWGIASTPDGLELPFLGVPGELSALGDHLPCTLLVDSKTLVASMLLIGEGSRLSVEDLSSVRSIDPNAAFVPLIDVYDAATGSYDQVPLETGVLIPANGTIVFDHQAAAAGNYVALLSGRDVWGNVGWKGFALNLTTPVRQP